MLVIRGEQLQALGRDLGARFEVRLADHARRFFPETCAELGDTQLRGVCREAVALAGAHGIVAEADVARVLDVMFVFGRRFDADPSLPWARRLLEQPGVGPTLRANRLHLAASDRFGEGRGLHAGPLEATTDER